MSIKNVTIAGAGTLGSQIAYQSALCGYQVRIWNPHPERAEKRIAALRPFYKHDLKLLSYHNITVFLLTVFTWPKNELRRCGHFISMT